MKRIVLTASIFLLSVGVYAQTARFHNRDLIINDGVKRYNIPDLLESQEPPNKPCVHAIEKRHGEYFVVVTISEWSRGEPKGGNCGSGVETNVKWLHVVNGKVKESTNGLYESCFGNREGEIVGWSGPIFKVTSTEDVGQDNGKVSERTIDFIFDAKNPENGIKETDGAFHDVNLQ